MGGGEKGCEQVGQFCRKVQFKLMGNNADYTFIIYNPISTASQPRKYMKINFILNVKLIIHFPMKAFFLPRNRSNNSLNDSSAMRAE